MTEYDASIRRHKAMDRLAASIDALCAETGMTEDELRRMLTEDEDAERRTRSRGARP